MSLEEKHQSEIQDQNSDMEAARNCRYILGLAIFLLSFGIYLRTLCPTVSELDSGELITVCYTLGIAHPAGYPLYTLLGKLFTMLPIRTVAFRMNMMSAFFASLTAVLVYFVVLRLYELGDTGRQGKLWDMSKYVVSASIGLLFALSRAFWSYAVITEVYTMKAFFIVLLIFILLTWRASTSSRKHWFLWIGAFIYGLSLGTRITMMLFGPIFLLYIIVNRKVSPALRIRTLSLMLLFFLLGFSIYLYLPIRSLSNPIIDWGNPENCSNFIDHVTGKQFRFMLFNASKPMIWSHVKEYIYSFAMQFTLLLYPICIIGAVRFLRNRPKEFMLLAGICLVNIIFNIFLYTGIYWLEHFFIPSFAVFAIWTGWGMRTIMGGIEHKARSVERGAKVMEHGDSRPGVRESSLVLRLVSCVLCILFVLAPLLPYDANYAHADQSENWGSYDYGRNILSLVEDNAVIVAANINPTFPLWYFQYVEKQRPDVTVLDANLLASQWIYDFLRDRSLEAEKTPFDPKIHCSYENWMSTLVMDFTSRNIDSRPFYFTFKEPNISAEADASGYILTPRFYFMSIGPVYQVQRKIPEIAVADPSIRNRASVSFSNSIEFLGYDVDSEIEALSRRGEILHLTYYWKLLESISDDLTVDILFTDADGNYDIQNGIPIFHNIHELAYDLPLTDKLQPGQVIKEECKLVIPSDIEPGTYYINVGICRDKTFLETGVEKAKVNFVQVGALRIL